MCVFAYTSQLAQICMCTVCPLMLKYTCSFIWVFLRVDTNFYDKYTAGAERGWSGPLCKGTSSPPLITQREMKQDVLSFPLSAPRTLEWMGGCWGFCGGDCSNCSGFLPLVVKVKSEKEFPLVKGDTAVIKRCVCLRTCRFI